MQIAPADVSSERAVRRILSAARDGAPAAGHPKAVLSPVYGSVRALAWRRHAGCGSAGVACNFLRAIVPPLRLRRAGLGRAAERVGAHSQMDSCYAHDQISRKRPARRDRSLRATCATLGWTTNSWERGTKVPQAQHRRYFGPSVRQQITWKGHELRKTGDRASSRHPLPHALVHGECRLIARIFLALGVSAVTIVLLHVAMIYIVTAWVMPRLKPDSYWRCEVVS
jgi:hypothetical protein